MPAKYSKQIIDNDLPRLQMSPRRRWAVTIGVMTGMAIAALEATVVGTAMPTVIAALGGISYYSWVFSAYLVTSTVTVPVWGKLSDLYGRRLLYQVGIGIFLLGTAFRVRGVDDSIDHISFDPRARRRSSGAARDDDHR